jgi:hypothetical protein
MEFCAQKFHGPKEPSFEGGLSYVASLRCWLRLMIELGKQRSSILGKNERCERKSTLIMVDS